MTKPTNSELAQVARAALDYIDALPGDVVAKLPVMPGFDRDWAENAIADAQQPVVDADDNFYSWFGREWQENYQHNQYTTAAKQMLGVMAESAWKAAHRAAMLQAGNYPVIPDTWIPVSERMPEERETVVLVADERGIVWCAEIQDGEIYPDEFPGIRGFGCAEAIYWMPLPAAPQQDVNPS